MMGTKSFQEKMFYNFRLSERIPEDHFLRKVNKIMDISFVRTLVSDKYSHTGQPSIDPEVLFKMMLIGYFYGITSERRLAEDISMNMGYMWFIGYDLDELTPNHSVLSKARSRYGKEVFEQFFQKILEQCIKAGLVKGEKVYMDSTYISANAAINSIVPRQDAVDLPLSSKEYVEKVFAENPVENDNPVEIKEQKPPEESNNIELKNPKKEKQVKRNCHLLSNKTYFSKTDPECSIVSHTSIRETRTPAKLAYKEHFTVDEHKRVITAVKVTPGAIADEALLSTLIKEQPCSVKEVCADTKYGTYDNYKYLYARGITPTIPPWIPNGPKIQGRIYKRECVYDSKTGTYTCPSGKKLTLGKATLAPNFTKYLSKKEDCRNCNLSTKCLGKNSVRKTIYRHNDEVFRERVAEHLLTDGAKKTMSQRKIYAEWVNAESKTKHGLRRAMFRGLEQVTIQVMMTASVQNLKRLIAQISAPTTIFKELFTKFCYFMSSLLKQSAFA
jgi:transposase